MAKPMTSDEAEVATKVLLTLTGLDSFEDRDVSIVFDRGSEPGMLRGPAACRATVDVRGSDEELAGEYEVEIVVRRRSS